MSKTHITKEMVRAMFLEVLASCDEDPWDSWNTFADQAQGVICSIRAIASNQEQAVGWAVERMDACREERYE